MFNTSKTIQKIMIDKNETVTPLAEKIGVKQQALSKKLNNPNEKYTLDYLQSICSAMGCYISVNIIDSDTKQVLYTLTDSE